MRVRINSPKIYLMIFIYEGVCTIFSDHPPRVFTHIVIHPSHGVFFCQKDGRAMGCESLQIEGGVAGTPGMEQARLCGSSGTFEILGEEMV